MTDYPILTFRPPWGHCVIFLGQDVATRDWDTPYRGWLWVHQGKTIDPDGAHLVEPWRLSLGSVIGAVRVARIEPDSDSHWARPEPGAQHWVLEDPRFLPDPLPLRGAPRLWTHPAARQLPDPEKLATAPLSLPGLPVQRADPPPPRRGGAVFSPDTRR